jgi:hypothetical protein
MRMVEHAVQECCDGGGIAEQLIPVLDGAIRD